ncbi:MFS transporter [Streptomyces sp. TLI_55]|uniref:MFS transporter n=1 Tax=Streptomyces sp. TLI_55 TaxID=1938861 RepID=UPI000BC9650C|nr:MFS transporter [Streptomyces sp. TLI_55]SNX65147.1 MFS transporter [Streptomyces sp. TLI_55]
MNPRLALASSVVGAVIVALDGTVLTIAQPTLQEDLGASYAQVQWTSTGYLIAVAGLLVFAGRLGDRYGHRRLYAIGMLGFGAASAGIGPAPGIGWVVGLRVVQGVFGALLQPATLGMLRAAYPPDRLRTPIAVRTAAIGVSAAVGPLVGGALVAGPGWRAVFFLNVVPALVFGLLALTGREPVRGTPVRLDVPGALLLAVTLGLLVHALVSLRWLGLAASLVAGAAFLRHERRTASPLLPRAVAGPALGVLVAASAALSGTLFVSTYTLQYTLGLDPLESALRCLPLAVLMVAAAPVCAILLRRVGARRTAVTAMAVLAAGVLLLDRAAGTFALCAGFALLGAGFGTVMVAATHVVVRHSPVESAGVAGGLQQTAMNVGPTLGVAVATTLMGHGALAVLAGVAGVGAVAGAVLPGRVAHATPADLGRTRGRSRLTERR